MSFYSSDILPPNVAGRFYPGEPESLRQEIEHYLQSADAPPTEEEILAILVPHAGYPFSGPVAAHAFKHASGQKPDTVLFIALSHQGIDGASVFTGTGFATPLGPISIDQEITTALLAEGAPLRQDNSPYYGEHSIEVNLPFVQVVFPNAQAATVLISKTDPALCAQVGQAIASVIERFDQKRILVVVSSDLSHYPPYPIACESDQALLSHLEALDRKAFINDVRQWKPQPEKNFHTRMCGSAAMLTALETAQQLGAKQARTLDYRNSGDSPYGEQNRVVGYGALAIYRNSVEKKSPSRESAHPLKLSEDGQRFLLRECRAAIQAHLEGRRYAPPALPSALQAPAGCFVTLKTQGHLRGCIGRLLAEGEAIGSLAPRMAIESSHADPRFSPLTLDELPHTVIQLSVLSEPKALGAIEEIEIGQHGLLIEGFDKQGAFHRGTLLPQVAIEHQFDAEAFLEATCKKAGLSKGAWRQGGFNLYTYEATIFSDASFGSPPYSL